MAFDFPNSPAEGAIYAPPGGPQYQFTGGVWKQVAATGELLNIVQTVKTTSGIYYPPAGLKFLEVTVVGGGGGCVDVPATGAGQSCANSGGGGGGTSVVLYKASDLSASHSYTVGAGGGLGGAGGTTTFAGVSGAGGATGGTTGAGTTFTYMGGGIGGAGAGGDINVRGGYAGYAMRCISGSAITWQNSPGGGTMMSPEGRSLVNAGGVAGTTGTNPGQGCSGGGNGPSMAAQVGGAGAAGVIILKEYF